MTATDTCAICHERVLSDDGVHWTHSHGDEFCGTGDGATAIPDQANTPNPRTEG